MVLCSAAEADAETGIIPAKMVAIKIKAKTLIF
jgi:hypothetical protein